MKTVYLLRHAKSSWDDPSLSDRERPLSGRGRRNAPEMGRRLRAQGHLPARFVSSPARRALTTARRVAAELGLDESSVEIDERLYFGGRAAMRAVLAETDDALDSCLIAGHNPDMTHLLNDLAGTRVANMVTAAIAIIEFDVDRWADLARAHGTLVGYGFPKGPARFDV